MTRLTFIIAAICALAFAAPLRAAEQAPTQAHMKGALLAYFEAMNDRDAAKVKAIFAADAMVEDPFGTPLRPAAVFVDGVTQAMISFNVLLVTATENASAAAALYINTPKGNLSAIEVFTFNPEGKITSMKAYWGPGDREGQ